MTSRTRPLQTANLGLSKKNNMALRSHESMTVGGESSNYQSSTSRPVGLLRQWLGIPIAYSAFQRAIGGNFRERYVRLAVRPRPGDRILDLGCGPGDILDYLPETDYVGVDLSDKYIAAANKRFKGRGRFICANVEDAVVDERHSFDIVMANGVLHHLDDCEALALLRLASLALKATGRFVSHDGCWVEAQSAISRWLLKMDRGHFVRPAAAYQELASRVFRDVRGEIRSDMLRVPYTHIILQCTAGGNASDE